MLLPYIPKRLSGAISQLYIINIYNQIISHQDWFTMGTIAQYFVKINLRFAANVTQV